MYEDYKKKYKSDPFDKGTIDTLDALMNNMKEEKKKRLGKLQKEPAEWRSLL